MQVVRTGGAAAPVVVTVTPALPLGARVTAVRANGTTLQPALQETPHDTHAAVEINLTDSATITWSYTGGAEILAPREELEIGQPSTSLRILDFRREGATFVAQLEGLAGREYAFSVRSAARPAAVQGAAAAMREGTVWTLRVTIPGTGPGYRRHEVRFALSP